MFFVTTRQKTVKIAESLGRFSRILHPGLTFLPPWERVAGVVDLKVHEMPVEITVKSKDNAFLLVPVKSQYRVIPEKADLAFYELDDPQAQIMSYVVNAVRGKANDMTMDEIFRSKDEFEREVKETLQQVFDKYGYTIVNVLVDDPQPSQELRAAFDRVLAAKRDQEASHLEKEAIRNRVVGQAEADAESMRLKAQAFVAMREIVARGNATAIAEFCQNLDITHREALAYFSTLDGRDALREAAKNKGTVVIVPNEQFGQESMGSTASMSRALANKHED